MKRFFLFIIAFVAVVFDASASTDSSVEFSVEVPLLVGVGERFPIAFKLNAKADGGSFVAPEFDGSLRIIAGPSTSQSSSTSIVNGSITRSQSYVYTYIAIGDSPGKISIAPASVEVDGKRYLTKATVVEVVDQQGQQSSQQQRQSQGQQQQQRAQQQRQNQQIESPESRVAADDLLLRFELSKSDVYKGEAISAKLMLYSRANLSGLENFNMATFNGFWAQDITPSGNPAPERVTLNGKIYERYLLRDYLLYAQQSGELVIDAITLDAVVPVVTQSRHVDPFDAFFGGGSQIHHVTRKLSTRSIKLDVKRLPAGAPASFNGAVGQYRIEKLPMKVTTFSANAAQSLRLRVHGTGNLTFVQAPSVEFPKSFESYSARSTEAVRNSAAGATGYKEFEYPFIARRDGDYTIPAVEFSFFDPRSGSYKSVRTDSFGVVVTQDERSRDSDGAGGGGVVMSGGGSSGIVREGVSLLDSDIRFIKLNKARFSSVGEPWILSWSYYLALAAIFGFFVGVWFFLRRYLDYLKNDVLRRGKQAGRFMAYRLKLAKSAMDRGDEQLFYEEMLRGVWGYMGDKLNIPVSSLTKDYVREELSKRGFDDLASGGFVDIITRCEQMQYSPIARDQMADIYNDALAMLALFEDGFKQKRGGRS
ncbi:MAG: BatD family protein [Rikenellaceae bacterium]